MLRKPTNQMRGSLREAPHGEQGASRACWTGKEHLPLLDHPHTLEDLKSNLDRACPVGLARRSAAGAAWPGEPS